MQASSYPPNHPRLLVSVRDANEARAALAGSVDILDIKEPSRGALGAAPEVWEVVRALAAQAGAVSCSAALGELNDWSWLNQRAGVLSRLHGGFAFAKVGFAGERPRRDWAERFQQLAAWLAPVALVPTAYADANEAEAPSPHALLALARACRVPYLLLDTCGKRLRLREQMDLRDLRVLARGCRDANIGLAIAGSLRLEDIPELVDVGADIIAVRGAVCQDGLRTAAIDPARVREWHQRVHQIAKHQAGTSDQTMTVEKHGWQT